MESMSGTMEQKTPANHNRRVMTFCGNTLASADATIACENADAIKRSQLLPRCWFEQLDGVAVGIFRLNLLAARTDFHLITKAHSLMLEFGNTGGQVLHLEDHPVP